MINLQKLAQYQESLGYLGQQINFPEKLTFHLMCFKTIEASHPAYEDLCAFREIIMNYSLSKLKQFIQIHLISVKLSSLHDI